MREMGAGTREKGKITSAVFEKVTETSKGSEGSAEREHFGRIGQFN